MKTVTERDECISMKPRVELEEVYPHPPERVWRALTDRGALAKWLLPGDFEPRPGHRFQFRAEPAGGWDGRIDCEVTLVEEGRRLSYTWQTEPDQPPTVVMWTLEPIEGGTRLRLTHAGGERPSALMTGGLCRRLRATLQPGYVTDERPDRRSFRRRPAPRDRVVRQRQYMGGA